MRNDLKPMSSDTIQAALHRPFQWNAQLKQGSVGGHIWLSNSQATEERLKEAGQPLKVSFVEEQLTSWGWSDIGDGPNCLLSSRYAYNIIICFLLYKVRVGGGWVILPGTPYGFHGSKTSMQTCRRKRDNSPHHIGGEAHQRNTTQHSGKTLLASVLLSHMHIPYTLEQRVQWQMT